MNRPGSVSAFFLVWLSLPAGVAAQDRLEIRVTLSINCKDDALRNRLSSFVSRELRQLGDVSIVEEHPHYRLAIVAIVVTSKGGYQTGYALSVVITKPLGSIDFLLAGLTPDYRELVTTFLADQESLEQHQLLVGSESDLRNAIEGLISEFDTEQLLSMRKTWERIRDRQRKKVP